MTRLLIQIILAKWCRKAKWLIAKTISNRTCDLSSQDGQDATILPPITAGPKFFILFICSHFFKRQKNWPEDAAAARVQLSFDPGREVVTPDEVSRNGPLVWNSLVVQHFMAVAGAA